MVIVQRIAFFILCFVSTMAFGADVKVVVEMVDSPIAEGNPIIGVIKITHDQSEPVDENSFKLKGDKLNVELQDTQQGKGNTQVSIYRFQLDPQARGLYFLPSIQFKVGDKPFATTPFTYTVVGSDGMSRSPTPTPPTPIKTGSTQNTSINSIPGLTGVGSDVTVSTGHNKFLKLEAFVEGGQSIFPGQQVKLIYRYTYTGSIALTKEELPMLEAKGFKKIGEKDIQDSEKGNVTTTIISQTVEAVKPGEFSFGPSIVEGFAYTLSSSGQRTVYQPALRSEAPAVKITVNAFPTEGKPASFNNAIGKYNMEVKLLSASQVEVGDTITLSLEFSGSGDLHNLPLPELCCQPGFSGKFKLSDLPPVGIVRGNSKFFVVDLQPLSTTIKEIPPIEFSSFDPETNKYATVHSEPIAIQVSPSPAFGNEMQAPAAPTSAWSTPSPTPKPVEVQAQPVSTSDIEQKSYGKWWVLLLIPLGLIFLYIQLRKKPRLAPVDEGSSGKERKKEVPKKRSVDIFMEALKVQNQPAIFYSLITRAFLFGLFEKKWIPTPDMAPEELPPIGISKEVRDFLFMVDEIRFSRPSEQVNSMFLEQARQLFTKLQQSIPHEP